MNADRQKVANRVLKLLALAAGSSFEGEAATARRLADDLMVKYNVSLDETGKDRSKIECIGHAPFAKGMRWEGIILIALAKLCDCTVFFNKDTLDHYSLVGTTADLEMLRYMIGEITRQRVLAWLDYKISGSDGFNKFCYGYAQALADKIGMITDRERVAAQTGRLRLWYETNVLLGKSDTFNLAAGRASSEAGMEAGGGASLHRGELGSSAQRQRLLR